MHEIRDIPVTTPDGKVVGKGRLETDVHGVVVHITFDTEYGLELLGAMQKDMVTGFSIGPEITPVMKKPATEELRRSVMPEKGDVITLDKSFQENLVAAGNEFPAGERIVQILQQINEDFHRSFTVEGPPLGQIGDEEIENRFGFHKATIEGPNASAPLHAGVRMNFKTFAKWFDKNTPASREKDIAMDRLEESSMWFHKAVAKLARNQGQER